MPSTPFMRRGLLAVVAATGLSCAGGFGAVLATPAATGATDPCAASEVARTIGSVAKSTGDYLDSHPETNQVLTNALQQQDAGPQTMGTVKAYFEANPKVALDMQGLANPLNKLGTQCKLPISLPQALSMVQAAQGGGLPGVPGGGGAPAAPLPGPAPAGGAAPVPGVPAVASPTSAPKPAPAPKPGG